MQVYSTINNIVTEMEALVKNVTGKFPLNAVDTDIVQGAIIDALQIVILEYGVETFKFLEQSATLTTVSGQGYVDLPAYALKVIHNTIRIPAEDSLLTLIDEQMVHAADPDLTETGKPTGYYYLNSGSPNTVRLGLWPLPDAVYTIETQVHQYPTDSITNFPSALNTAIKLKAKAMSCLGLGLLQYKPGFDDAYDDIMKQIKDSYQEDRPRHVMPSLRINTGTKFSERRCP